MTTILNCPRCGSVMVTFPTLRGSGLTADNPTAHICPYGHSISITGTGDPFVVSLDVANYYAGELEHFRQRRDAREGHDAGR